MSVTHWTQPDYIDSDGVRVVRTPDRTRCGVAIERAATVGFDEPASCRRCQKYRRNDEVANDAGIPGDVVVLWGPA